MAIFIEGLHPFTLYSFRTHWKASQNATLHDLMRHVTSLVRIREDTGAPRIIDFR